MTDDGQATTTIQVTKKNRTRLNKLAGKMKAQTGEMTTANDALNYLFTLHNLDQPGQPEPEAQK